MTPGCRSSRLGFRQGTSGNSVRRVHFLLFVAMASACSAGCGASPDGDQRLISLNVRADVGDATRRVVVEVEASGRDDPAMLDLAVTDGAAGGTLRVLPDSARTLRVTAYDATGRETHRGSVLLEIAQRATPASATLIASVHGDPPITVIVGNFIVAVDPAAVEVTEGDTFRLEAVVLDDYDDTVEVRVRWRTLDPARSTVDSTGLVEVHAPGTIPIVATVAGVGAATTVTVRSKAER